MKPSGIFLVVDDDPDEHELFTIAMAQLGLANKIVIRNNGKEALDYLKSTDTETFVILSDMDMPVMGGLEFKESIENDPELKGKAIPFIFHSNAGQREDIIKAYTLNIQGYFAKAMTLDGTIASLEKIIAFWTDCIHPKNLK
ncbi:MAG: histidine kinase [Bacteroidetes bacterium]|nr:histidine kinase [Bacteroidota bacterium]